VIAWAAMRPQEVVHGGLTLAIEQPPGLRQAIRVVWRGKSDDVRPARFLAPHFQALIEEAARVGAPIEMRFEELEYINSSTLSALAQLIRDCRTKAIKLVMVYDPDRKWQKLSFDALRVFVNNDSTLELRAVAESRRS